ncbi:hypothetical protein [Pontiella desulfatans]|uniref:hypothetical protein n=1 Tax=Pontiella desulfatans TaxID=2750659 RepID=UPI00109C76A1|nr:hypothetical protein [Pontiella desulfatans]
MDVKRQVGNNIASKDFEAGIVGLRVKSFDARHPGETPSTAKARKFQGAACLPQATKSGITPDYRSLCTRVKDAFSEAGTSYLHK